MFTRNTPEYTVAAKTVLDHLSNTEGALELVEEATLMAQVVGHANLVSIIGVITSGDPLVLVLQYCENGSVLSYLKKEFADGNEVGLPIKMNMVGERVLRRQQF
jgi:serine/threonine protein kinase